VRVSAYHLAQLNIAVPRFPIDDPQMAGFTSMLDEINALADATPGFVWRLVSEGANDATALRAPLDGADQMVNMSVWESREALWEYVYRSAHLDFLRRRGDWFEKPAATFLVLWWVPAGHIPSVDEGLDRLNALRCHGPNPEAFTFRHHFDVPAITFTPRG
jgi:hypothetical protein